MNGNKLKTIDKVKGLQYLYELHANSNEIDNLDFITDKGCPLQYLQAVDLSINKLKVLPHLAAQNLRKLNLEENEISECTWIKHPNLTHLNLNKNKFTSLLGLKNIPKLEMLSLND